MRIDIDHLVLPEPEAVLLLKAEVRRLEGVIAALADQDATLSVCDGAATLTVEERAALQWFGHYGLPEHYAATLVALLERTA